MSANNFISSFEYLTLLAILRLGENAYGAYIRRELSESTEKDIAIGAIYTVLKNLTKKGFISRVEGDPISERGGRARIYYKLEALGEERFQEFENSILRLRGLKTKSAGSLS